MKKLTKTLVARMVVAGVVAAVDYLPGQDGGYIVRVTRLAEVETAETVAAGFAADFGVEVLVAF